MSKLSKNEKKDIDDLEKYYGFNRDEKLRGRLSEDVKIIKDILKDCDDVIYRDLKINNEYPSTIFLLDGFTDDKDLNSHILRPLHNYYDDKENRDKKIEDLNSYIKQQILVAEINTGELLKDVIDNILIGKVVLLSEGLKEAFFIDVCDFQTRAIDEPVTEAVTRGPRDGFTEFIETNITLVRRRLKTSRLKINKIEVGKLSNTQVAIAYIEGIVEDTLLTEVKDRISKIDIEAVLESGYIEEFIEDNKFSVFPQLGYTERPDRLVSSLLEGQVGILTDNTPITLIAPQTFMQFMQSSEDYYERFIPSTMIRIIRYLALFAALLLPSLYIAVLTFHPGMLPKTLLLNIWISREDVPFPVIIEAVIMEIFFEGLREAGVRLPRTTSQTVSIVGALIIGQAAVQAGIVSASMVIVVSVTGIASFIIPRYSLGLSIRVLRFGMMALAGAFGLYGIFIGILFMLIHMAKLRSFGVPYLSPIAPLDLNSLKDVIIRAPWWFMKERPKFLTKKDNNRMASRKDKKNEN